MFNFEEKKEERRRGEKRREEKRHTPDDNIIVLVGRCQKLVKVWSHQLLTCLCTRLVI